MNIYLIICYTFVPLLVIANFYFGWRARRSNENKKAVKRYRRVKKITAVAMLIMVILFFVVMSGEVSATDIWAEWEAVKQIFLGGA
ncbi:MAG: hypothetical protein LBK18_10395 [Prevotellaceae bacterium]|jgi:heme/copper-type cytochrome/quinol oxidase subunit 2|nr:hypothetical protein [Prevotellaceae bacterium]